MLYEVTPEDAMPTSDDNEKYKKIRPLHEDAGEGDADAGESGSGGQSGAVEFKEFFGESPLRDDQLPPDEIRRLLAVHAEVNEAKVKNQKEKRDNLKALKEGKLARDAYRQAYGADASYTAHPALKDKAQFSGTDAEVSPVPTENKAEANEGDRNELKKEFDKQFTPQNMPKFNPKPSPY